MILRYACLPLIDAAAAIMLLFAIRYVDAAADACRRLMPLLPLAALFFFLRDARFFFAR